MPFGTCLSRFFGFHTSATFYPSFLLSFFSFFLFQTFSFSRLSIVNKQKRKFRQKNCRKKGNNFHVESNNSWVGFSSWAKTSSTFFKRTIFIHILLTIHTGYNVLKLRPLTLGFKTSIFNLFYFHFWKSISEQLLHETCTTNNDVTT